MSAAAINLGIYSRAAVTYTFDVAVIGGGIIGLATARELLNRGVGSVAVLERESAVAQHQTGRNSGVIHAGLYYAPNSLKARLCLKGMQMTYDYLRANDIPFKKVGKLVVATSSTEIDSLQRLFNNASTNGVPNISYLDNVDKMRAIEPEVSGLAAIHSPETGIVDWSVVARSFARDIMKAGGRVLLEQNVIGIRDNGDRVDIQTRCTKSDHAQPRTQKAAPSIIEAKQVVTCVGAYADRVASMCGGSRSPQIVPIRGEYLVLPAETRLAQKIRGNIYPVPVHGVPFLGVHYTPTMNGDVVIGPNAVPAFSRTGYSYRVRDISVRDLYDMLRYEGVWRAALRYGFFSAQEVCKSLIPSLAISRARNYVPALKSSEIVYGGRDRCGVRAQAIGPDGSLIDDFLFERTAGGKVVHARNVPSPGATSSMAIAEVIADYLESKPVYQ